MSRRTSTAVHSLNPNDRHNYTPHASNRSHQESHTGKPLTRVGIGWNSTSSSQRPTTASHLPISPILEDGFKLVSRPKVQTHRGKSTHNKGPDSFAATTNKSAAAVRRRDVYEGPTPQKPISHYKQSCLPVDERDPVLLEIERSKGFKLSKESFKPGTIIRTILHEPDFHGTTSASYVTQAAKFTTDSIHGPIFSKTRKMIVLATFQDNYIALPLYTHNGRGLEGKVKPEEFVSVRDHRIPGSFTPLSMHEPLVTDQLNAGIELFHVKSALHITYPVSRKYSLPVVYEGRLRKQSVLQLASLFADYISPFLQS